MSATLICEVCGARTTTLRRGRCAICYMRWADNRPVGFGASCLVCADRRREYLRLVEFRRTWLSMCHNCSARLLGLQQMPLSLAELRSALLRERRSVDDRRQELPDLRLTGTDRRGSDRRIPFIDSANLLDDEWVDAEDLIIEILEMAGPIDSGVRLVDAGPSEVTRIQSTPRSLPRHGGDARSG